MGWCWDSVVVYQSTFGKLGHDWQKERISILVRDKQARRWLWADAACMGWEPWITPLSWPKPMHVEPHAYNNRVLLADFQKDR